MTRGPLIVGVEYEDQPGLQEADPEREASSKHEERLYAAMNKAARLGKPVWLASRIADFQEACDVGEGIFWDRGEAYGDATAECGLLGAAITLTTDVARIRRLLMDVGHLTRLQEGDEELTKKLADALIDAHNYAAIAYFWLKQGNLMGRANYE